MGSRSSTSLERPLLVVVKERIYEQVFRRPPISRDLVVAGRFGLAVPPKAMELLLPPSGSHLPCLAVNLPASTALTGSRRSSSWSFGFS